MTRLFVAVYPPPAVVRSLAELPRPDAPGVRWVPPAQYHVTLRFFGDADPVQVGHALDGAVASVEACDVRLGPQVSRLGRSVICVPVSGLDDVGGAVVAATGHLGRPPEPRVFHAHLTLARLKARAACGLAGAPFSASFRVDAVHLVESITREEGAEHHRLRSWSLAT